MPAIAIVALIIFIVVFVLALLVTLASVLDAVVYNITNAIHQKFPLVPVVDPGFRWQAKWIWDKLWGGLRWLVAWVGGGIKSAIEAVSGYGTITFIAIPMVVLTVVALWAFKRWG